MDIDRARYFSVFSSVGSLVKASEVLGVSQPALSKALRLLQDEVGIRLIEAEGRGLRLTEAGLSFKEAVEPLLAEWIALPRRLAEKRPVRPASRIGSFEVFTTYFLGHLLRRQPIQGVEVHELPPGKLEEGIADRRIDIGITYVPIPKAGVRFTEAGTIQMGVFGGLSFRGQPFSDLPFVIPVQPLQGVPSKVMGLDGWPDHEHPRRVEFKVTLMESALELCRRGLAVAYLPKFVARLHNESVRPLFQLHELGIQIPRNRDHQKVFLIQPSSEAETPLARAIARSLLALR